MTEPAAPPPTSGLSMWLRHIGRKGLIGPAIFLTAGLVLLGWKALDGPDDRDLASASYLGAKTAIDESGAGATTTTEPPTTTTVQLHYDFLECTHLPPNGQAAAPGTDARPCVPVLPYPLTDGARKLIGFEPNGTNKGQLSTPNTQAVFVQLQNLQPAEPCLMWLGLAFDENWKAVLTVYTTEQNAPQGAAKLLNCAPQGKGTPGTIPTQGQS